ncbi:MAG TPA: hypothetical protein VFR81_25975 [Longimicrobium sp.]|jgi:hypothetical protein|nr:hypothetical protein [Longimicrobium sp.]
MSKLKLELEELAVESFATGGDGWAAPGTVRGMGAVDGSDAPDDADDSSDDFPGYSGFNSCQTCILVTCGTCPDQA